MSSVRCPFFAVPPWATLDYHLPQSSPFYNSFTRNLPLVLARIWADGKSLAGRVRGSLGQICRNLANEGRCRGSDETIPQTNLRTQQQETFIEYKLDCYYSVRCNTACRRNILVFSSINRPCCVQKTNFYHMFQDFRV